MCAVVVAEGLDIFWALQKGEGCLGWMGPDTAGDVKKLALKQRVILEVVRTVELEYGAVTAVFI
jgi:hypothetical protein